jgi:NAD-dependent DNA ligase
MALEVVKAKNDMVKICQGVEACQDLLHNAIIHLKDSEAMLKALVASHTTLNNKIDKIGERMLVVAAANLFVLVLVLLVFLVK